MLQAVALSPLIDKTFCLSLAGTAGPIPNWVLQLVCCLQHAANMSKLIWTSALQKCRISCKRISCKRISCKCKGPQLCQLPKKINVRSNCSRSCPAELTVFSMGIVLQCLKANAEYCKVSIATHQEWTAPVIERALFEDCPPRCIILQPEGLLLHCNCNLQAGVCCTIYHTRVPR